MPLRRFITGGTGIGTGPHLHAGLWDPEVKDYINPAPYLAALRVGGKPVQGQFRLSSGYGPRQRPTAGASAFHRGIDFATPEGTEVEVAGGSWQSTFDDKHGGGRVSVYDWAHTDPKTGARRFLQWRLLHGSERNALGRYQPTAPVLPGGEGTLATAAAPTETVTVEAPAVEDWRQAASDPQRSTDPSSRDYWRRADMRQWASAHPELAQRAMARYGFSPGSLDPAPAQTPAADAAPSFKPIDRGALNGSRLRHPSEATP